LRLPAIRSNLRIGVICTHGFPLSDNDQPDDSQIGQHFIPLPPDEGWFSGLSSSWKAGISTAEFTLAVTFAMGAWTVGADTVLRVIALAAAWISASFGFATVANKTGTWRVSGVLIVFGLFAIEGGFLTWHYLPVRADIAVSAPAKPVLDNTIQFGCEWSQPPAVVPQHKLFEFEMNSAFAEGGAWVSFSQQPGATINLINPDAPDYFVRCRFNNLGQSSLVNVTTDLKLAFNEVEQLPSGTRSGKIVSSYSIKTLPVTLSAGQAFEFYVRNFSPLWANLSWSPDANGQLVGSDKSTSFRLIADQRSAIGLVPFIKEPKPIAKPEGAPSASTTPTTSSQPSPQTTQSPQAPPVPGPTAANGAAASKSLPLPRVRPTLPPLDESDKQGKQGRTLIAYSATELVSMFGRGQILDVFTNKWMKVEGHLLTVPIAEKLGGKDYYAVGISDGYALVAAYFDTKKWGDQLLSMKIGDGLRVACQFTNVSKGEPAGSQTMLLAGNCEALPP
jgi:hypothetical protein